MLNILLFYKLYIERVYQQQLQDFLFSYFCCVNCKNQQIYKQTHFYQQNKTIQIPKQQSLKQQPVYIFYRITSGKLSVLTEIRMSQQDNQKLIEIVQKKITSQQNILSIIGTLYYFPNKNPNNKKIQDSLIITTNNLFFIQGSQIKKILPIKQISYITLAILGKQVVLHCDKEWIRFQSGQIINILGNILHARQRFLLQKTKMTICLELERTLQILNASQVQKKSFFSMFKKADKKQLTASGRRVSFSTIQVNQRNFLLQIGRKCYKAIFQNSQLLHISGNAQKFRFDAQNYEYRDLSKDETLYWRYVDQQGKGSDNNNDEKKKKQFLRRKISKESQLQVELIRRALSCYKYNDYNEDIIYALQMDTHFEIITQVLDKWTYGWQYLIHYNNYEKSLINGNTELEEERSLKETQLKSIFYKLHAFIQQESQKNNILSSLSLDYVYMNQGDVRVSTVFCKIFSKANVSYIAPQEFKTLDKRIMKYNEVPLSKTFSSQNQFNNKSSFQQIVNINQSMVIQNYRKTQHESKTIDGSFFSSMEIYKVNLWKLGMLLYELAYHKLPFPIQYVAYRTQHHEHIKVHFPERDVYSIEFHHFLKSLICKDPIIRGMRTKGDVRMSVMNPQITNIMNHEWVLKGKK